jgi:hypothetical protein
MARPIARKACHFHSGAAKAADAVIERLDAPLRPNGFQPTNRIARGGAMV